jgi:RsiW-degrading membrane proteinase PrsW (M82 family)
MIASLGDIKILLAIAVIGGILPTLIWLWFFLKEDERRPEPWWLIFIVFLAGMMSVMVAYPLEKGVDMIAAKLGWTQSVSWYIVILPIVCFAFIEEIVKYTAARLTALRTAFFDEPIDAIIYLITAALGFAAMENFFYLFYNLSNQTPFQQAIFNAQLRFLGATLLHVVTSASIGFAISLAYYLHPHKKYVYVVAGIITAVALHTLFNFLIMEAHNDARAVFEVFGCFWLVALVLIFLFEKAKRIKAPTR